jgi:ligand-binding SRPBCC domain-containing protein
MGLHLLRRAQVIPASIEQCWAFFSDPRNLAKITPPALDFRIVSDLPPTIRAGMLIEYRVRPLFGIPMTWVSEITHVDGPRFFIDEQRIGPYAIWHHEHTFRELDGGRTEISDAVQYAPPFGLLGELVHPFFIAPELAKIFAFREKAVREIFGD